VLKAILFAALAACGVPSTTATAESEQPTEFEPPEPVVKPIDGHFCCQSVDPKTKSGEGCTAFSGSVEVINQCAEYLYCSGDHAKHDGKTYCL
jgi:hypothetical protein